MINLEWKNISLNSRLIDMSLSVNKIENDLWFRLIELKYQNNILQQIQSNQQSHLITLNEQYQRCVNEKFFFLFCKFFLFRFIGKLN